MTTLQKYKLLSKKWRLHAYLPFSSSSALLILSLLLVFLFSFNQQGFTQNYYGHQFVKAGKPTLKAYEKAGAKAFKRANYSAAMEHYRNAIKIDSTKIDNYFQLGLAARAFDANIDAKEAFAMVKMLNDPLNPYANYKDAIYYYSVIEKEFGNVDNAVVLKEELDANYNVPKYTFTKINNIDDWAQIKEVCYDEVRDASSQIRVIHLDSTVNTIHSEVNPFWRNGKLHYASLRFRKENDTHSPARLYAKTLQGELGTEGDAWGNMNVKDMTTAHFTFDPIDTTLMYFTLCDYTQDKQSTIQCQIYYRKKVNGVWSTHKKVSDIINQPNYTATQPSIGYNDLDEKVLFYVTDRPDGKGGLDIWSARIIGPNKFGKPELLPINTTKNDITPFYHYASKTLYFSSQGNKKWEHYDVYKIKNILTGTIEPLPYPINSNADDFGYFLEPDSKRGFMVSSRADCNELESGEWACHDIFKVDYCIPKLQIEVIDPVTDYTLTDVSLTLSVVGENYTSELKRGPGNDFVFTDLDTTLRYQLKVEKEEYKSIVKNITLTQCDSTIKIYLEKSCEPKLTVNFYHRYFDEIKNEYGEEIPLTNSIVQFNNLTKYEPIDTISTNAFIQFSIDTLANYEVVVTHDAYPGKREQKHIFINTDTINFLSNNCEISRKVVFLPPLPNPEFDTIACYFDHDRPKRIRDTSYNDLFNEYLTRFGKYQSRFAGVSNIGTFNTTFCDQPASNTLKDSVTNFFCDQVDFSFKLLTRFKDDLLIKLAKLDKNGNPYIIDIKGYTSPVGDSLYNVQLADRRIEIIKKYFYSIPELQPYLYNDNDQGERNPLITIEKLPFGEDRTVPIFEGENDYRNTIYNPHSAIKRRVEIIRRPPAILNELSSREE